MKLKNTERQTDIKLISSSSFNAQYQLFNFLLARNMGEEGERGEEAQGVKCSFGTFWGDQFKLYQMTGNF